VSLAITPMCPHGHPFKGVELALRPLPRAGSLRRGTHTMTPVDRDLEIVQFVAKFQAVTSAHVRGVAFAVNTSATPVKRALIRLVAQRYLAPYRWRYLPSNRAGSGSIIYQLGLNGWRFMGYEGAYKRLESFDRHTLAITDLYVALTGLERLGLIEVLETVTEPENWRRVGHTEIRPDLFGRILSKVDGGVSRYFFETDLGSEHERQIKDKMRRYHLAWTSVGQDDPEWNPFPKVVFVVQTPGGIVTDQRRKEQLGRWITDAQLFSVCTLPELAQQLIGRI
jgi:hypothetical protein